MKEIQTSQFTPTKWDSAEQKAKFVKHFLRFVEKDFPFALFPKWFYTRLSMTFRHLAHYNLEGFFEEFFTTTADKLRFLEITLNHPWAGRGDPAWTYSDAEKCIQEAVKERGYLSLYKKRLATETEAGERKEPARLQAKYGKE
jgi:hypothetical protein